MNVFKRVNGIVTNKEDYDNFEILDFKRKKICKWMVDNLTYLELSKQRMCLKIKRMTEKDFILISEKNLNV